MEAYAQQGDTLYTLCIRPYGRTGDTFETVLYTNPGLAELGAVLPHGTAIELPEVNVSPVKDSVNLWG